MLEMVQQAVLAFEPEVTETVRLEGRELPPISNESQEKTFAGKPVNKQQKNSFGLLHKCFLWLC